MRERMGYGSSIQSKSPKNRRNINDDDFDRVDTH